MDFVDALTLVNENRTRHPRCSYVAKNAYMFFQKVIQNIAVFGKLKGFNVYCNKKQ